MSEKPIILAMANPTPEIMPDEAKKAGTFVVGTGRPIAQFRYNSLSMKKLLLFLLLTGFLHATARPQAALVLQSDFGTKDGAVASMKGVAYSVSPKLQIFDLTHEIPAYNIWEAAYRLKQTAQYWPRGTVFVSVVDPGVGTDRNSVVLKTKSGHFFVTPDNGTLTFVAEELGIESVRKIDEAVNRLRDSEHSYTFHGRDVYAFTGAKLAAGIISVEQVGQELPPRVVAIAYQKARFKNGVLYGNIPVLDIQYGNVWTNIDRDTFFKVDVKLAGSVWLKIIHDSTTVFNRKIPYHTTFGKVPIGQPLLYLNSLNNVSFALREANFSEKYGIESGATWHVQIEKRGE